MLIERIFCIAVTNLIYSTSIDNSIIIGCFAEYHEIGLPAARQTKPFWECLEDVIAKLASEKASSPSSSSDLFLIELVEL